MESVPPEFLQRAYNRLRHPDWGTLEEAMNHPVHGKLLQGLARQLHRQSLAPPEENPPHSPPAERRFYAPLRPIPLDRKRLASGEKDEE